MAGALARHKLNRTLQLNGLATLDDPRALLDQLSLGIRNHDQFRKLLLTVEPEKRRECYQSFIGRLCFEPRPLETYIMEGKMEAESRKLPEWEYKTKQIKEFGSLAQEAAINRAVAKAVAEQENLRQLLLTCRKCTRIQGFHGRTRRDAWKSAKEVGWYQEKLNGKPQALCPQCAPGRIQ